MHKVISRRTSIAAGAIALFLAGCSLFPESSFELASESRLPKWFSLPSGLSRSDVTVTMSYYVKSSGRTAEFSLRNASKKNLAEVVGTLQGSTPMKLRSTSASGGSSDYPMYERVTVNGVTEVIEHRRLEPVFYLVDDPQVLDQLEDRRSKRGYSGTDHE